MTMVTAIVRFNVNEGASREEVFESIASAAGRFEGMPELIRKNFLYDGERGIRGGVYTWKTLEAAEKVYAEGGSWRENIRNLCGADPDIEIFETPVIVDNEQGSIKSAA